MFYILILLICVSEQVKNAERVQLSEIPLPDLPVEANTGNNNGVARMLLNEQSVPYITHLYFHTVDVNKYSYIQNPGVVSLILAQSHTFAEIDHEIISTAFLLPSAEPDSRRVAISY